mmetsp:Transcript_12646/g.38071  ORF Transcript_12646/g.38071 Transcript_12646/m.38071 type:complete len:270 (-) Transcript_12646:2172-2981(-)
MNCKVASSAATPKATAAARPHDRLASARRETAGPTAARMARRHAASCSGSLFRPTLTLRVVYPWVTSAFAAAAAAPGLSCESTRPLTATTPRSGATVAVSSSMLAPEVSRNTTLPSSSAARGTRQAAAAAASRAASIPHRTDGSRLAAPTPRPASSHTPMRPCRRAAERGMCAPGSRVHRSAACALAAARVSRCKPCRGEISEETVPEATADRHLSRSSRPSRVLFAAPPAPVVRAAESGRLKACTSAACICTAKGGGCPWNAAADADD